MSDESKREKEITFQRIREESNGKMLEAIENCNIISKMLGLGEFSLPNIMVTYNNKIIALEKEFAEAGIDFYDRFQCESRFIIEQRLQALILKSNECISRFTSTLSIPKEQLKEFFDSYKKPTFFEKTFKGVKYQPKKAVLTPEQKKRAISCLRDFEECNQRIEEFSIKNDIIEAILFGRILSTINGVSDFDERIQKIDSELQRLGYNSISDVVMIQIATQDLSFSNINTLISVSIPD